MADGNNVILRVGEMLVTLGQKLQLLSGLGIKEPHTQQETSLTVYRNTLSFLETLIICLRKEPIGTLALRLPIETVADKGRKPEIGSMERRGRSVSDDRTEIKEVL